MRFLPSISREGIVLPWYMLMLYPAWLLVAWLFLMGTGFDSMDYTPIPAEVLVPTVITIVLSALVLFTVLYLVSYQEKKSKVLELKANALKNGTPVDEISLAKVESFNNIYVCALLIGAAISAVVAYLAMCSIVPNELTLGSVLDYILYSVIGVIIAGVVLDKVFVHPIADGSFKKKVLDPLADSIIEQFQTDSAEVSASGLTNDQIQAIANAIAGLAKK